MVANIVCRCHHFSYFYNDINYLFSGVNIVKGDEGSVLNIQHVAQDMHSTVYDDDDDQIF